jgi:cysteinyl-tRNA synthetase
MGGMGTSLNSELNRFYSLSISDQGNLIDFFSALLDDIATPVAISSLAEIVQPTKTPYLPRDNRNEMLKQNFKAYANLLGLLQKDPEAWFKGGLDYDALVEEYDSVRAQALAAKEAGDKAKMGEMFKRSDEIRDQFKAEGVVIESGAEGKSSWRKA